jgi:hypothetical protein
MPSGPTGQLLPRTQRRTLIAQISLMDAENHYDSDSLGRPDQAPECGRLFLGLELRGLRRGQMLAQRALIASSALTNKNTAKAAVPMEFASQPRLAKSSWFSASTSEICAISVRRLKIQQSRSDPVEFLALAYPIGTTRSTNATARIHPAHPDT